MGEAGQGPCTPASSIIGLPDSSASSDTPFTSSRWLTLTPLALMNLATSEKIGASSSDATDGRYRSRPDRSAPRPTCGEDGSLINNDLDFKVSEPRRSTLTPALLILPLRGQPEKGYGAIGPVLFRTDSYHIRVRRIHAAHLS